MEYVSVMREAVFLDAKKPEAGRILLQALGASLRFGEIKVDNVIEAQWGFSTEAHEAHVSKIILKSTVQSFFDNWRINSTKSVVALFVYDTMFNGASVI